MGRRVEATAGAIPMMTTRLRRDARGASAVEYALLLALVAMIVFASVYALGRSPDRPASVLGDTFNNPPAGSGPGPGATVPVCGPLPPGPPGGTTTTTLCRP
jgi:Flp pilus assembly pilin Flp